MRLMLAGASGLIGRALIRELAAAPAPFEDGICLITRSEDKAAKLRKLAASLPHLQVLTYSRLKAEPALFPLSSAAVINLAGENIGAQRLGRARLGAILSSRLQVIEFIKELAAETGAPALFIQASALSILKDSDIEMSDEAPLGASPLAVLLKKLESTVQSLPCPTLCLRLPLALSPEADLTRVFQQLPPLNLLDGSNYLPCAAVEDCARALLFAAAHSLTGTLGLNAPHYLTARQLIAKLGRKEHRLCPLPLPVLRVMLQLMRLSDGRMALFLENKKFYPAALLKAGFTFRHPDPFT